MPQSLTFNEDHMEIMKMFPDKSFDLAVVDPPYFSGPDKLGYYGASISSIGVEREGYEPIGNWDIPSQEYFTELFRVSKNQIIWGCNYYAAFIPSVGRIVWDKVNGQSSFSDAEIASCSFHDSVRLFSYMWNGMMQGKSIEEGRVMQGNKKLNEERIHPTQKPVILYDWIFEKYAKPDQLILDTHLGSQSSRIAAYKAGLRFVGCEVESKYYNDGNERFENFKIRYDQEIGAEKVFKNQHRLF